MFAIVQTGGKQYRVEAGDVILVEKLIADAGADIVIDQVLMIGDGDNVTIGRPVVEGAKVTAQVVSQAKGPKVIVFKKRSKKGYKKTQGHRQKYTELKIKDITSK